MSTPGALSISVLEGAAEPLETAATDAPPRGRRPGWLRLWSRRQSYNSHMRTDFRDLPSTFEGAVLPLPAEHRPDDEIANLITHGGGFVLSLVASTVLLDLANDAHSWSVLAACSVYSFTLVGLYGASTLSHLFYEHAWRRVCRTLDQAFIFLLIAGSFTPIATTFLHQGYWQLLLPAIWTLALAGVVMVLRMRNLTTRARTLYLVLGWFPAISLRVLLHAAPQPVLVWLIAGGMFYSVGTLFLWFDTRVRYFHALWHTFVIAGSICHYLAILQIVVAA